MSSTAPPTITLNQVQGALSPQQHYTLDDLTVPPGDQIALLGKSGSGKSTVLNLLSGMISAQRGSLQIMGQELIGLSEAKRDKMRRAHIGMIFQTYQLLPEFSVIENVRMGATFSSHASKDLNRRAEALIDQVGLAGLQQRRPHQLSVGQQQRVAIARALVKRPALLLADEPTGALDPETGSTICDLLQELVTEHQSSLLFVTHDHHLAQRLPHQREVSTLLRWTSAAAPSNPTAAVEGRDA